MCEVEADGLALDEGVGASHHAGHVDGLHVGAAHADGGVDRVELRQDGLLGGVAVDHGLAAQVLEGVDVGIGAHEYGADQRHDAAHDAQIRIGLALEPFLALDGVVDLLEVGDAEFDAALN
jgi:hypothetical protein